MKDNEIIWLTLRQEKINNRFRSICGKAEKIVEDYKLWDEKSALSNTQLQTLARISFMDPESEIIESKFSLELKYKVELTKDELSNTLRNQFKDAKIKLQEDEDISIKKVSETEWWIAGGSCLFNVKEECERLNVYELGINGFIRHQADKSKANQGYKTVNADDIPLGKTLCRYLWYDPDNEMGLLKTARINIYQSNKKFMEDKAKRIPSLVGNEVESIHSKLIREFIKHLVGCAMIGRKEKKYVRFTQ
jgi:hypothetical protein